MKRKRLLKLADFLETIPKRVFDMSLWEAAPATKPEGKKPGKCGFAGCALGWAAHVKLFRGLRMFDEELYYQAKGNRMEDVAWGFHAAEELFEITNAQATFLFDEDSYDYAELPIPPKRVAKRIRKLVADNTTGDQ